MKFTPPTDTHDYKPLSTFSNGDIVEFKNNLSQFFLIIYANSVIDNLLAQYRHQDKKEQIHMVNIQTNQLEWEVSWQLARKVNYKLELLS
jgi:uncharacterized protein YkvS